MIKLEHFKPLFDHIEYAVREFRKLDREETIRVVSHLDADGICASSLLLKALSLENRKYSVSIVQQLDESVLRELAGEQYKYIFFTDIGSGQLKLIEKHLGDRIIFVLDHHEPELVDSENIVHINPHLFGIGGSKQISGAGVVFLFSSALTKKLEDFAHIAVIGAIGDIQDEGGFSELNNYIIEIAEKKGKLKVIKGLRMFGAQTRPLHKLLEYCTDIYIPGVSGSESGAIQLLKQLGIEPKNNKKWRRLVDLSDEEIKRLVEGIIVRRLDEQNPEEIVGPVYILKEEDKGSP
ncbi:DHH family phosphoesterase, partial [Candidatus Woesearchaeota archaeon]|nr:DHH family phosphoesterase [Candidatus Woesearchaeota archaeon]